MLLMPLAFVLAIRLPVGFELHADADECLTLDQSCVAAEPLSIAAAMADRDGGEGCRVGSNFPALEIRLRNPADRCGIDAPPADPQPQRSVVAITVLLADERPLALPARKRQR